MLRRSRYKVRWLSYKQSRSKKGWHVVVSVTPRPKCPEEVVALQAILGSDPYREACNLLRARQYPNVSSYWKDRWNVLYYEHTLTPEERRRVAHRKRKGMAVDGAGRRTRRRE